MTAEKVATTPSNKQAARYFVSAVMWAAFAALNGAVAVLMRFFSLDVAATLFAITAFIDVFLAAHWLWQARKAAGIEVDEVSVEARNNPE